MKLLLPLDVVHPYSNVLGQLKTFLPLKDMDIIVLYVAEKSQQHEGILKKLGKSSSELDDAVKAQGQRVIEEVSQEIRPLCNSVTMQVLSGDPAQIIVSTAKNEQCELIVISASNSASDNPYILGSVSNNVVKHAGTSVLVLRSAPGKAQEFKRVIVGVDGSKAALAALTTFANQFKAASRKIEVALVHVVSIAGIWKFISPIEFIAAVEDNMDMTAQVILAEADKALAQVQLKPTDLIVKSGDPATELMKAGQDLKADLIVVGSHGKTLTEEFTLGSCPNKLFLNSQLPVLIVK
jgi:nucleotide-binding universal stress UspA family protein